jgi:hypothetical protein
MGIGLFSCCNTGVTSDTNTWIETTNNDEENFQLVFVVDHIMQFKVLTEEDQIQIFLVNLDPLQNSDLPLDHIFSSNFQEDYESNASSSQNIATISIDMS